MSKPRRPTMRRVFRGREATKKAYDRLAPIYDLLAGSSEHRAREEALTLLSPSPGEAVLELGCGTGTALRALAGRLAGRGRLVGLDLSPRMLAQARRKLERAGLAEHLELYQGDAVAVPLADGAFDAVFTAFTLELFDTPQIPKVLAEVHRLLRPGGRFVVVSLLATRKPGPAERVYIFAHDHLEALADCRPIFLEALLQKAGLQVTSFRRLSLWGLPVGVALARNSLS